MEAIISKRFRFVLKLPAPIVAAGIWYLSSQSILPKPKGILGFDKFQHLLAYAVLAAAIALWFSREKWRQPGLRLPVLTAALGSVYGIIDEVHQYFVPGRDCNVWDWLTNTLGAVLAAAMVKLIARRTGRLQR
ncbi:MAG: VanZ family protein [Treponema sp.]|jgi:VanZ family protein|nr:VanZ family protein [Treponema sp.]